MAVPSPGPEVAPEAVRTVVVACCGQCAAEFRARRRATFCSWKCRAAWHRRRHETGRAARERDQHAQLAALRRREDELRTALDGIRRMAEVALARLHRESRDDRLA